MFESEEGGGEGRRVRGGSLSWELWREARADALYTEAGAEDDVAACESSSSSSGVGALMPPNGIFLFFFLWLFLSFFVSSLSS